MHSLIFGNPDFQKLRQVKEMTQGLTALAALREDLVWISASTCWVPVICNGSPTESVVLVWPGTAFT